MRSAPGRFPPHRAPLFPNPRTGFEVSMSETSARRRRRPAAEPAPPARREGRRLVIDLDELEELAGLNCTLAEAAAWFGVSASTLGRRLKEPAYRAVWERGAGKGRVNLRRAQLNLAERSSQMAIFLGRQILGQSDPEKRTEDADGSRARDGRRDARDEIARRIAGIAARAGTPGDPERPDGG
jgi:hypothetical protein